MALTDRRVHDVADGLRRDGKEFVVRASRELLGEYGSFESANAACTTSPPYLKSRLTESPIDSMKEISNWHAVTDRSVQRAVVCGHKIEQFQILILSARTVLNGCNALQELQVAESKELLTWH